MENVLIWGHYAQLCKLFTVPRHLDQGQQTVTHPLFPTKLLCTLPWVLLILEEEGALCASSRPVPFGEQVLLFATPSLDPCQKGEALRDNETNTKKKRPKLVMEREGLCGIQSCFLFLKIFYLFGCARSY